MSGQQKYTFIIHLHYNNLLFSANLRGTKCESCPQGYPVKRGLHDHLVKNPDHKVPPPRVVKK